jgi:signal transduction histidine kinase/PAS domain-containing protein
MSLLPRIRQILKTMPRGLKIALGVVLVLILIGGLGFLHFQSRVLLREVEKDLTAIARLQVDQITAWRDDQINDAEFLGPLVAPEASRYLASSDVEDEGALRTLLQSLAAQHDFADVLLMDQAGEVRWQLTASRAYYSEYLSALAMALATGEPVFIDLHRGLENPIVHLSIVVPLSNASESFCALVLIIDAEDFLYPLLRSWPLPSESAETLLVREEDDQVLFLNDLRHQPGAALDLRIPLTRDDMPAVKAVQGVTGFVRGRDYRGVPVAAVLLPVPESSWVLVTKLDADEAFSEGLFRSVMILISMLVLMALFVLGIVAVQQRMEKIRYVALHQSQARQTALLEAIYRNAPMVLMVVDSERRIRQVNGFTTQFAGRSSEDMLGLRGGEALRCLHALDEPEGCGFGPYCQECVVRNTVLDTLAKSVTHLNVEASLPFMIEGQEEELTFLLSTTPLTGADEPLALVTMLEISELVQARRATQRLLAQQQAINQLTISLGKEEDLESIYRTIYTFVQDLMDAMVFIVAGYDSRTQLIQAEYVVNQGEELDVADFPAIPLEGLGKGTQSRVIHSGEPFYSPDLRDELVSTKRKFKIAENGGLSEGFPGSEEAGWDESVKSAIYVPMMVKGEVIGVIQVQSQRLNAYSQEDIDLLSGMANVAAVAVQNARLIIQLADAVAERTAELEEKVARLSLSERAMLYMVEDLNQTAADLAAERRKLELSNQELEAFAYSVSHDLRAPLRAINGFASFLAQDHGDDLNDDGQRFIMVIQESAAKMDRLITDLLNLSRVSRAEMRHIRVDMSEAVQSVYDDVASESEQAVFDLEIHPLPLAECDPLLIRQVWKNLIENALKYSAKSAVKHITVGGQTGEGELVYWVRDRGAGFDPQYQQKLFGVFQRLHSEGEYAGSGVGLAIVKRIIQRHGGRVWAEGEPDQGATFYFALPC